MLSGLVFRTCQEILSAFPAGICQLLQSQLMEMPLTETNQPVVAFRTGKMLSGQVNSLGGFQELKWVKWEHLVQTKEIEDEISSVAQEYQFYNRCK